MFKRCLFNVILEAVNLYGKFYFMESLILQNRREDFQYLTIQFLYLLSGTAYTIYYCDVLHEFLL